jgi:threonine aldolase
VLSDGGGAAGAQADLGEAVPYLRKATMQLASKTRFVSAQLLALLGDPGAATSGTGENAPLWLRNAARSNAMAARLRAGIEAAGLSGDHEGAVRVTRPTEANVVFATLPRAAADRVRARARFYDWAPGETAERVEARWMCAWDTTEADVDEFVRVLVDAL